MIRAALAAAAALALLPSSAAYVPTAPPAACPQIVAHRTDPLEAPENTLAGIRAAGRTGAAWVEMDVRWSKSHFPVLMHDETVRRTTGGTGEPSELGLGDLRALPAQDYAPWKTDPRFAAEHVPYAYDFLAETRIQGLRPLLHIVQATPPPAADVARLAYYLQRSGLTGTAVVMGSYAVVRAMRAKQPALHYALIEYNSATIWRRASSVRALGVTDYVIPERDVPSPGIVQAYHDAGIQVWSWSSDSATTDVATTWRRLSGAGVNYLITNQPAAALATVC